MKHLLIGNPNVGKTTFFNTLTDSNAHVGNWSGVTVDKLEGTIKKTGDQIIDLPGTYSVTPSSEDEGVVTYALLNESFDQIINIVDATHLKRNLHLSIQLLETGYPVTVVMNMMDVLDKKGLKLDAEKLEAHLGAPVCLATARLAKGTDALQLAIQTVKEREPLNIYYGERVEYAIELMMPLLKTLNTAMNKRWIAIQLLEGNNGIYQQLTIEARDQLHTIIEQTEKEIIQSEEALSLKGAIFNKRREFIHTLYQDCINATQKISTRHTLSYVDRVLTHPIMGTLIFMVIMFSIYMLTFDWLGTPVSDLLDALLSDQLVPLIAAGLTSMTISEGSFIYGAIIDGIIAGVGGVIVFIPQILILYFGLSILEATGYMARVAIIMDHIFSRFGLNGKAIVPLVTGFGCNVPAIMATRTVPDRLERLKMMTIIPFMSCAARLPIYALFVGVFFNDYQAVIMMGLYLLGIVVALGSSKLLSVSYFKKTNDYFVLEVPPYRMPQFKNLIHQTLDRGKDFLLTAGKFILIGSLILWFLDTTGPTGFGVDGHESFLAIIGGFIAPLFAPLGFGTWQAGSGLVVGFLAKELVASSMLITCGGEAGIAALFTPLQAVSFLVFSLLYIPCLATVGVMKQETKSYKMTGLMMAYGLCVAYVMAFIIYQVGTLLMS